METKIKNRINQLTIEYKDNFKKSIGKDTHVLMKIHYRTVANEVQRVIVELKALLN